MSIRWGPEPAPQAAQEMRAIQQARANELSRVIRETLARMRKPLWFWEM